MTENFSQNPETFFKDLDARIGRHRPPMPTGRDLASTAATAHSPSRRAGPTGSHTPANANPPTIGLCGVLSSSGPSSGRMAASATTSATEGIAIGGSVANSQITNPVNQEDPVVLAAMTKTFADQMAASAEARAKADARAADLAAKLGFTSSAVAEFFTILGQQNVPDEKIPARLIEIATHFAQTQNEVAALEPSDPHAADLAGLAKQALDAGQLTKADTLLEQAKDSERAALREARQFVQRAQEAVNRHALNLAKMESTQGDTALTQLRYVDAATHYEVAAAQAPPSASEDRALYLGEAGDARETSGNLAAARADYQASLAIKERLAKADPGNAVWQRALLVSHVKVGDVQVAQSDLAAALASYQASLAIRERLAKADPGDAVWQRDLSVSDERVGDVQVAQGDLAAALASYQASLAIRERLAKADPGNGVWQRDLSWSYSRLAKVRAQQGDRAGDAAK
jgi:tetratricopeptide (TPR) repeat protein